MRFETKSGSIYEVDETNKRVRRVSGIMPGTSRVGNDGQWKAYYEISPVVVGQPVLIIWKSDMPLLEDYTDEEVLRLPTSMTSNVVAVGELN
jgi:hypothetical protein